MYFSLPDLHIYAFQSNMFSNLWGGLDTFQAGAAKSKLLSRQLSQHGIFKELRQLFYPFLRKTCFVFEQLWHFSAADLSLQQSPPVAISPGTFLSLFYICISLSFISVFLSLLHLYFCIVNFPLCYLVQCSSFTHLYSGFSQFIKAVSLSYLSVFLTVYHLHVFTVFICISTEFSKSR